MSRFHKREVRAATFGPKGKAVVTGNVDNTAQLWFDHGWAIVEVRRFVS
jgi:hypothetical protein